MSGISSRKNRARNSLLSAASPALHLQIWNVKQNNKTMFSLFYANITFPPVSVAEPATLLTTDTCPRYCWGSSCRLGRIDSSLFLINKQASPNQSCAARVAKPTAGFCRVSNAPARGPISRLHLQGQVQHFFSVCWTEIRSAVIENNSKASYDVSMTLLSFCNNFPKNVQTNCFFFHHFFLF